MPDPKGDPGAARRRAERRVGLAKLWARAKQILTTDPTGRDEDDAVVEAAAAEALTAEARELHGALAKVAQLAAYDPGAAFGDALELERGARADAGARLGALWDGAAAVGADLVERVIVEELGASPAELFAAFERAPLAAASLGQVHAARGHDGREYVVKVQYPGIAAALEADLAETRLARRLAGAHLGEQLDEATLAALREAVQREVDYEQEAGALTAFARIWASEPTLQFPEVDAARSARRVLTMTRARGATLVEVAAATGARADSVRAAAASAIFRFTWGSPLAHAVLNTDPNPGNFLVEDRGEEVVVWCLDFGSTLPLPPAVVEAERRLWWGLTEEDSQDAAEKFRMALAELGLLGRADALSSDAHRDWERALAAPFQGGAAFRYDVAYARRLATTTARALATGGLRLTSRTLLLWRQRLAAVAVLGLLGAEVPSRRILRELIGTGRRALR
ncbi:MAG: AarF/UbiB family protein [Kofleriaceae bacterium]